MVKLPFKTDLNTLLGHDCLWAMVSNGFRTCPVVALHWRNLQSHMLQIWPLLLCVKSSFRAENFGIETPATVITETCPIWDIFGAKNISVRAENVHAHQIWPWIEVCGIPASKTAERNRHSAEAYYDPFRCRLDNYSTSTHWCSNLGSCLLKSLWTFLPHQNRRKIQGHKSTTHNPTTFSGCTPLTLTTCFTSCPLIVS